MRLRIISLSVLLHIAVILLLSFGAGWFLTKKNTPPSAPTVMVDIIKIADKSQTDKKIKPKSPKKDIKKKTEDKVKNKVKSIQKLTKQKKPPKAATNKLEPKKNSKKPPAPPKKEIKPKKIADKPIKKPPQKQEKPKNKNEKQKDFSSLLKNLAEGQEKTEKHKVKEDIKKEIDSKKSFLDKINIDDSDINSPALPLGDELTISEIDALRKQLAACWSIPVGAKNIENMVIEIHMLVNQDRTVKAAKILNQAHYKKDSFFKIAAEAALRAVKSPECSPLELPADKYSLWKEIIVTFDPKDMF